MGISGRKRAQSRLWQKKRVGFSLGPMSCHVWATTKMKKFGIPGVIVRRALKGVQVHSVLRWPGEVVCFALSSIFESSSIANTLGPSPGRDHSRDYQEDAEQQATMAYTT